MNPVFVALLTVCGLAELAEHSMRGVTHVLSIRDPDWPEPVAFRAYDPHHRTTLQFHDVIEPAPGLILPDVHHVEAIFSSGIRSLATLREVKGTFSCIVTWAFRVQLPPC